MGVCHHVFLFTPEVPGKHIHLGGGGGECHHDVVLPTPKVPGKHMVCVGGGGDNVIMHYFPHQKFQIHVDMGGGGGCHCYVVLPTPKVPGNHTEFC